MTETFDGEVSLAWEEPLTDGGSKIIGYVVERRDVKRKTWVLATDRADSCEFTVTGLQKGGVEYLFRVSARNRVGTGEPVETDNPVEARSKYGKTFLINYKLAYLRFYPRYNPKPMFSSVVKSRCSRPSSECNHH